MTALMLALAIIFEVVGTLSLRAQSQTGRRIWVVPVIAGYLLTFAALWQVLNLGMPIAVAYGVWTAAGIALVALCARLFWKDPFNWSMAAGIGLIGVGVVLVELV